MVLANDAIVDDAYDPDAARAMLKPKALQITMKIWGNARAAPHNPNAARFEP
jgi:dipeptide transport system substrate-binding protein